MLNLSLTNDNQITTAVVSVEKIITPGNYSNMPLYITQKITKWSYQHPSHFPQSFACKGSLTDDG